MNLNQATTLNIACNTNSVKININGLFWYNLEFLSKYELLG